MRCLWLLAISLCLASSAGAQDLGTDLFNLGGDSFAPAQAAAKTEVTAVLVPGEQAGVVTLEVQLVLPPGANTYSQSPDFPKPTTISLTEAEGWRPLDERFTPHPPPKKSFDENFGEEVEKFFGTVVFTRRYYAPQGTDLDQARLNGKVEFLVCDKNACRPQTEKFTASSAKTSLVPPGAKQEVGLTTPAPQTSEPAPTPDVGTAFGYEITPRRSKEPGAQPDPARIQFELSPADAGAGKIVTLALTMTLAENWTTYGLQPADDTQLELPTVIQFTPTNLRVISDLVPVPAPQTHETKLPDGVHRSATHEKRVTWKQSFEVLDAGPYGVEGTIRYQICEKGKSCLSPHTVQFSLGNVQQAAHLTDAAPIVESFAALAPLEKGPEQAGRVEVVEKDLFALQEEEEISSLGFALGAAFLAGLILNVMPCVLPVLAIKILSLVQQAGESRQRMLTLNLAYTAGVIFVFLILATLASTLKLGWGAQFQNTTFTVVMILVVFAMGLSLLGVFELPIPGLIPSAHHHNEGLLGAFNTGIIATLLATPCTGPYMVPVFAFLLKQPPAVIFLIFGVMGLGMASPYLLAGFFPAIVNWLPKPGMWMVRFKQFSGFVVLATVLWLMTSVDLALRLPVLILLLAEALGLWMVGNLYDGSSAPAVKWKTRLSAGVLAGVPFFWGWQMLDETQPVGVEAVALDDLSRPEVVEGRPEEMPWSPFSESRMIELRKEGRPMIIDFTANWCGICKWNEKWALNTTPVVKFVKDHDVVPLLADYTKENEEIRKWLNYFKQDSVPLTIIVPPGQDSEIVALRGQYTQSTLLEKLREAVGSQAATEAAMGGPGETSQVSVPGSLTR